MKKLYKVVSAILALCMILTILPVIPFAPAAEVVQRYELDTDGIDAGGVYLIVSANSGSAYALRRNNTTGVAAQAVTVLEDADGKKYIETDFNNESNCQLLFGGSTSGTVTAKSNTSYILNISTSSYSGSSVVSFSRSSSYTCAFENLGDGAYRISRSSSNRKYYLRYNNGWTRSSSNSPATVYLFKLTDHVVGCDVTYDGNGATEGTLPENGEDLTIGEDYTVAAPTNLRKDVGEDSWSFYSWNTKADGTGDEYFPGDTMTLSDDVTLYAQWNPIVKFQVAMITYLNGVATDVDVISGTDKQFYVQLEGGDGTYIPLKKTADGTYTTKVEQNGTYVVYATVDGGDYEAVHGHKVVIYGQDGSTECMHYTITHDLNGGNWPADFEYDHHPHHSGETHYAPTAVPVLEGNRFLGWQDAEGNVYQPGDLVTASIDKALVLTALWEKTVDVIVNVTIDHNSNDGGYDNSDEKDEVTFDVMRTDENGNNHLVGTITVTKDDHGEYVYTYSADNGVTSYVMPEGKVTFGGLQKGTYTVSLTKSHYEATFETVTDDVGNTTIAVNLKYAPTNFDLDFDVVIDDWANVPTHLRPTAVGIKVTCWGYNANGELGWHIITQQAGDQAPVSVVIDPETGKGTGFYAVWKYWADGDYPYYYRVAVTSYVMADGTLVPVTSEDHVDYVGGVYSGTVTIRPAGGKPGYPDDSETDLQGTIYDSMKDEQDSTPTVTVQVKPFTVTFDPADGTVNGQQKLELNGQYLYPDLNHYVGVPTDPARTFQCWVDEKGEPAVNMAGQLLSGNVTYTALYKQNVTVSGDVVVNATYLQNGETIYIKDRDRIASVQVVLQKKVGDTYNDVASYRAEIRYEEGATEGVGSYVFAGLPNDGTQYRVTVLALNYAAAYDNNNDDVYAEEESAALPDTLTAQAKVDAHLSFEPTSYLQIVNVDASQIHTDLRPTGALVQILYRDLGGTISYQVINQHTGSTGGLPITMIGAWGEGSDSVWAWHSDGALYEYQVQVHKLYGNDVEGAYSKEGTVVTDDLPFTIRYGSANNYSAYLANGGTPLMATLVPKEYPIILDLNLGTDLDAPVYGLEGYMIDNGEGGEYYAYMHTWSYASHFNASPYREGYVFKGWVSSNEDDVYTTDIGAIHVGSTLTQSVTLTAQWEPLKDTDYTIRYLEMNTDKVLHPAKAVTGDIMAGSSVKAVDEMVEIEGYVYVGAMTNGVYSDKSLNPDLVITRDPLKNLMVIYYLPDGSDGYTEQVESNLNINKTATLENNGTYTITMDTFTKDNPITTRIEQNTPMDIVLVLDQSASMYNLYYPELSALKDLQAAVSNFVDLIADHGRNNQVDHRIAMVGFACNGASRGFDSGYPNASGNKNSSWCNTGVYDSHGVFHTYKSAGEIGFTYTEYTGVIKQDGSYYTKVGENEYLLLTYHDLYRHLITEEEARVARLNGETIYGYVAGEGNNGYVELTRNSSGLWLYDGDNKKLYSKSEFFTFHTNVWTHRHGLDAREIHAYGVGADFAPVDGHTGVYTRTETTVEAGSPYSIYRDALVPVTTGANGAGAVTPGLQTAINSIGANGMTYVSYGMQMANSILEANPVGEDEDRIRFVVVFTDGKPGDSSNFDENESNRALEQAYITQNTYGADVYTVGLYGNDMTDYNEDGDQAYFMEGLSSNYPNAQSMDDVWVEVKYDYPKDGFNLGNGGPYFVYEDGAYRELTQVNVYYGRIDGVYYYDYTWGYTNANGVRVVIESQRIAPTLHIYTPPVITNHQVNGYDIYRRYGVGYQDPVEDPHYYYLAQDASELKQHFASIVTKLTTKVTTTIELNPDTILRDIMNQGLVLTDGTVITAYKQPGSYDLATGEIIWAVDDNGNPVLEFVADLDMSTGALASKQIADIKDEYGNVIKRVPYIQVYNYDAANATNPNGKEYHPHTVDVTGYDFTEWYINDTHTDGYKMVVVITRVEARDDAEWGRSTNTNNEVSGLWLPENDKGDRELLLPFDQPTTIFVERAYVLDYGKEFTLKGWYFDDEDGKNADPIHLDLDIASGMNWFDENNPNIINTVGGAYGNTKYGNVRIEDGEVIYSPTTMSWGGYDQFYVFGNTWRKTVLAQDANENGNLWNKVTVIPANNVYYEDSFLTMDGGNRNGIEGFVFGEGWEIVGEGGGDNYEIPEHQEIPPYGDVHGWTDSLQDDFTYTDGTAHGTGLDGKVGATATFTFTGTGVEVYTRTNDKSGVVVAILTEVESGKVVKSIAVDNLAVSGDYYHIPTVAFKGLSYKTYTVQLIATSTNVATDYDRYEYYIDGVRIYNPLGIDTGYQEVVKDAYGLEVNSIFTEVRDILLQYKDFNVDMEDDTEGIMGAVFIDWIQPGQESGNDQAGIGVPTYEIGTFEAYGPKNEVYLSAGQAIVLKVREENNYFVGLKSLEGGEITVNVSGIDQAEPTEIVLSHTTDMYYRVTPVDGYIVIQNGSTGDQILSITNLRTTNLTKPMDDGGILKVSEEEVIQVMGAFTEFLQNRPADEVKPEPEIIPSVEEQLEANRLLVEALFADVRLWLQAM